MSKLGFTFYPKDWWTSDSFYALSPFERYIYLELLFMMYDNGGSIKNNKAIVERRLMTTIKDEVWIKITELMVEDGDQITNESVNKRLKKAITNRENGKKGGRPRKNNENDFFDDLEDEKPKKPNLETQEKTQNNPPYKEKEKEKIKEKGKGLDGDESPPKPKSSIEKIEDRKKREREFYASLVPFVDSYSKEMLRSFYEYWAEPNRSGSKMKWEMESTWDLSRRLAKWQQNDDKWSKTKKIISNEQSVSEDPELERQRQADREKRTS